MLANFCGSRQNSQKPHVWRASYLYTHPIQFCFWFGGRGEEKSLRPKSSPKSSPFPFSLKLKSCMSDSTIRNCMVKRNSFPHRKKKNNWERFHCLQLYHIFRYHLEQLLGRSVAWCALYMMQKWTPNGVTPKGTTWAKHPFSYSFLWSDLQLTCLKTWLQFLAGRGWDKLYLLFRRAAWPWGSWWILPLLSATGEPARLVWSCA